MKRLSEFLARRKKITADKHKAPGDPYGLEDLYDTDNLEKHYLENTETRFFVHRHTQCQGQICTIHNRTDHLMRSFPQSWRSDRMIIERICPHGIGHPDPDEYRLLTGKDDGIHGCDGCCKGTSYVKIKKRK